MARLDGNLMIAKTALKLAAATFVVCAASASPAAANSASADYFRLRGETRNAPSVLPRQIAAPDWAALAAAGLGEVLAHHVALAAPRRLIVFGRDVSPLLGHDPAQVAQSSLRFNHEGVSVPLVFAPALEALLERPALKRGLWARWLDWEPI